MQLCAEKSLSDDNDSKITVSVPPTRSDVLHPCDVMEVFLVLDLRIFLMCLSASNMLWHSYLYFHWQDIFIAKDVAIAYGFNSVKDIAIAKGYNISKGRAVSLKPLRLEEFSHIIRLEVQNREHSCIYLE